MKHHDIQLTGSISITGSLSIPVGTTAERPLNPKSGSIRMNTTTGVLEIYTAVSGAAWENVGEQVGAAPASIDIEYLLVAGGGGGSQDFAGGGGAGGLLSSSLASVESGSSFTVTIGGGGNRANSSAGYNGDDSTIAGTTITTITAIGGGGGAGSAGGGSAGSGGSGGGAGNGNGSGGSGTAGQGFAGHTAGSSQGAGGGGAGAAATTQNGAIGKASSITGTSTYYAGGGAGSTSAANQTGGQGGGGNYGTSGTVNTGGGGGGYYGAWGNAGDGGSGVAIFAYDSGSINCAGGIVGDAGNGRKYHQFNTSGTFKIGSTSDFQIVTDGLVLHVDATNLNSYPGTGTTWYDLSGNNLDFSMVGTPTYNSEGYFSGWNSSNYFQCNAAWSSYLPTGDNPRTICALVRRVSGTVYEHVLHYGTANTGQAYGLAVYTGTNAISDHRWGTSNYGNAIVNTDTNYFISTRYHTTTYPGARTQVNGNFYNESTITTDLSTGTNTLRIGCRISDATETWNGNIYSVMVYDRALTDNELLQNYEAVRTNIV